MSPRHPGLPRRFAPRNDGRNRHRERSVGNYVLGRPGLPRFARSDDRLVQGPCAVTAGYGGLAMARQAEHGVAVLRQLRCVCN